MIRLIRWLLTSSIRYSYRFIRAILGLPLLLLPISQRVRNQIAGALAIALWFFLLLVPVAVSDSPWWAGWMVMGGAVLVIVGVVRMEGRRPIVRRRPVPVR
jgi:peptidoglycan/LPS O-acetylase OafA/YrhL